MPRNFKGVLNLRGVLTSIAAAVVTCGAIASPAAATSAKQPSGPVSAKTALNLPDAFVVHGDTVTIPGRTVHLKGVVRPYVPGQVVNVEAFLGGKSIGKARLKVTRQGGGSYGGFTFPVKASAPGTVTIKVGHPRTNTMLSFLTSRKLSVLDPNVHFGSTGWFVQLMQERLAALHIYVHQSGVYDSYMGWAIDAYHRLLTWGTSQVLDGRTISFLLDGFGKFQVKFPSHGKHAEGDLTHQLLALLDGSNVQYIFPISSGKPSTPTILGDFRVYRRVPGYLPDGMYYSSFFTGGYAIHGFNPAPDYPASHGCMRLPIQDAIFVYDWLTFGDWVDTYYR